jgi:hypothetical protein
MKKDYTQLCFDEHACPRTTINLGMWSYVAPVGGDGEDSRDLIVSGLREGVRYYQFEDYDSASIPRYGRGEAIPELDGWNLNVILHRYVDRGETRRGLFARSGGTFVPIEAGTVPCFHGDLLPTGIEGVLGLHRFGRYISTATLFRRPRSNRSELAVTVVDMSEYYPGEFGVYGGRAIGIDQSGRNIGYDDEGKWIGGRGRADIYLFVIEDDGLPEPKFAGILRCKGHPIEILDRSGSIAVGDFDGDGRLEAIILNEWRFDAYRLSDACGEVNLESLGPVLGNDGAYFPDIQFPSPASIILPGKSLPDLVMGSFSGELFFARNLTERFGEIRLSNLDPVTGRDRELRFGGFAVPALADLDGDGLLDLVVGDEDGHIAFIKNVGSKEMPAWGAPVLIEADNNPIQIVSGYDGNIQGPDERLHGYACPCPYDWTGNGLIDLIVGNITGFYFLYRNIGTIDKPEFLDYTRFTIDGNDFRGEWRVRPGVADLDGDGIPELIALDPQGMLCRYPKATNATDGHACIDPGERLVDNLGRWIRLDNVSGAQGRAKLVACDWTGSGTIDIIVGTGSTTPIPSQSGGGIPSGFSTFVLLENIGDPGRPVFVGRPLDFPDGSLVNLGTHSCAPAVGDINGDGKLEIIAGEETGRMFLFTSDQFRVIRRRVD